MELWIRSQFRDTLTIINKITLSASGRNIFCDGEIYGTYKSKERTLEILDEIQSAMITLAINGDCVYIYEMPKE